MGKATEFNNDEWEKIFEELEKNPKAYGLPESVPGSALLGSFKIEVTILGNFLESYANILISWQYKNAWMIWMVFIVSWRSSMAHSV